MLCKVTYCAGRAWVCSLQNALGPTRHSPPLIFDNSLSMQGKVSLHTVIMMSCNVRWADAKEGSACTTMYNCIECTKQQAVESRKTFQVWVHESTVCRIQTQALRFIIQHCPRCDYHCPPDIKPPAFPLCVSILKAIKYSKALIKAP